MADKDYYDILGVDRDSSKSEIKKAYRRLARKYHPDVTEDDNEEAEKKFKEISEAYEVLADDEKRQRYDNYGHSGLNGQFGGGGFDWNDFSHFSDIEDIFSEFGFGGGQSRGFGGSIFDALFNQMGGRGRSRGPQKGPSLRYDVEIGLEDAAEGLTKELTLPKWVDCDECDGTGAENGKLITCPKCNGQGQIRTTRRGGIGQIVSIQECPKCNARGKIPETPCDVCDGKGRQRKRSTISVDIPAGVESGTRLRVPGAGREGSRGGPPGDLFVVVHVKEHDRFRRDGPNIWLEWPISFPQAALGDEIRVPTINGKAKLNIPPGTQGDTVLRMKDSGLPRFNGRGKGDQFVRVQIEVPEELSEEQRELISQLAELDSEPSGSSKQGFFDRFKKNN